LLGNHVEKKTVNALNDLLAVKFETRRNGGGGRPVKDARLAVNYTQNADGMHSPTSNRA